MAVETRQIQTRHFTVDEFNYLGEVGLFDVGPRVELVEGEIFEMSPVGPKHGSITAALTQVLVERLGRRAIVWPQGPAIMDQQNEPLPDVLLARPRADRYSRALPGPADIVLVVEVTDTTVHHNTRKMQIYARNGVPEAWMVLVQQDMIRVHTEPSARGYRLERTYVRGESIPLGAFPDVTIAVDDILPPILDDDQPQE